MTTELDNLLEELYRADDSEHFDLELADDIVARFPTFAAAWAARARTHYKLDEHDDAASDVREALARDPHCPDAAWIAACLADDCGDTEQASALLDAALARFPAHYGCLLARAWICHEAGEFDSAVSYFQRAVAALPMRNRALNSLMEVLMERGRTEEAIAAYRQARKNVQGDGVLEYNIGTHFYGQKDYASAIEFFDRGRALLGEQNAIQHNRALCLEKLERHQDAIDEWNLLLKREPNWTWPRLGRMGSLRKLGRTDAAFADFEILTELAPNDLAVRWQGAGISFDRKQYLKAFGIFCRLVPDMCGQLVSAFKRQPQ